MLYPLRFQPIWKNYLWGGRNLERFGKKLPEQVMIAESWDISGHPNGHSIIANGYLAGIALNEAIKTYSPVLLGNRVLPGVDGQFPLLIKWIDAREQLSVQVHPDDRHGAAQNPPEPGKNEMWYVAGAEPGAHLIAGLKPGITRECFADAIAAGTCLETLQHWTVQTGDAINIPAGLVHSIGAGLIICEIQQCSDTTYRVYDYDRRDENGQTRPLHIDQALAVIDFSPIRSQKLIRGTTLTEDDLIRRVLVLNRYFFVEEWRLNGSVQIAADPDRFRTLTVLSGSATLSYLDDGGQKQAETVQTGESLLIPACLGKWSLGGKLSALTATVSDFGRDTAYLLRSLTGSDIAFDPLPENLQIQNTPRRLYDDL